MKNKGFTVIELMATFILIALISTLLIRLTITLKEIYINGDVKTALITKQSTMTDKIYQDLKNEEIQAIRSCGTNCANFVYAEKEKQLTVDMENNKITYDNYSIKLDNGSYLGEISFNKFDDEIGSIISIKIPIYNRLLKGDFGININYQLKDIEFDEDMEFGDDSTEGEAVMVFPYKGDKYEVEAQVTGDYKLEVWGAQGGYRTDSSKGGYGGYSKGTIHLTKGTKLYVYVGGSGNTGGPSGGFNGGGLREDNSKNYPGGGGASDIRVGTDSLYARVIVAGGGGSDGATNKMGSYGGGSTGGTTTESYTGQGCSSSICGQGGTQTAGGAGTSNSSYTLTAGTFGNGGKGFYLSNGYGGAGGGGWYGGSGSVPDSSGDDDRGGGGGSGYVFTESTASNYPSGCLLNSDYYLTEAETYAGNTQFPSPTGGTENGHKGDGYVAITFYGKIPNTADNTTINSLTADKNVHGVGEPTYLTAMSNSFIKINNFVNWSSSDESVATVDDKGKVTFKKAGTVTITVKSKKSNSTKTIELTAENYTGIPSGTYTAGNNVSYAGYNWKVIKDNGDTTTLLYTTNCYKTGTFGSNTEFAEGNNAYTVMSEFSNIPSIKSEIIKGGIILDDETNTYARPPKKEEITFSGVNGYCNTWTMTKYNNSSFLYYVAYNSNEDYGFKYSSYTGVNSVTRYPGSYYTKYSTTTTVDSFVRNTYYESYNTTQYDSYASPTSTGGSYSGNASNVYSSDEWAYVETSSNSSLNSSETTDYTTPINVCNNGVSVTRYYSPGSTYRAFYAVGGSEHCNNNYYTISNYRSTSMGFKPVITVKEK